MAGKDDRSSSLPGAEEFLVAFESFAQAVRRARGAPALGNQHALTLSQYGLLQPLASAEEARVRELAGQAGVTASTATRILDTLERRGIVARTRSPDDRRAVTVTLTSCGRDLLHSQDAWIRARQEAFHRSLPPGERELVPDLLVRLAALIDEIAAGPVR